MNVVNTWISRTEYVKDVQFDIRFNTQESYYFGPKTFTPEQWETLREPLYRPKIDLYDGFALLESVRSNENELRLYYDDVLNCHKKYGHTPTRGDSYFWLRPLIYKPGGCAITFPWYDTVEESKSLINGLIAGNFSDGDQGWEFEGFSDGQFFYFRESDPDTEQDFALVNTDHSTMQAKLPIVLKTLETLIAELVGHYGHNYWSYRA